MKGWENVQHVREVPGANHAEERKTDEPQEGKKDIIGEHDKEKQDLIGPKS